MLDRSLNFFEKEKQKTMQYIGVLNFSLQMGSIYLSHFFFNFMNTTLQVLVIILVINSWGTKYVILVVNELSLTRESTTWHCPTVFYLFLYNILLLPIILPVSTKHLKTNARFKPLRKIINEMVVRSMIVSLIELLLDYSVSRTCIIFFLFLILKNFVSRYNHNINRRNRAWSCRKTF